MFNNKEGKWFRKITITQAVLGVIVLVTGSMVLGEIIGGRHSISAIESREMEPHEELVRYQKEITKMQESGVVLPDPFNTDRLEDKDVPYLGRLTIPKIGVDESILLGTAPDTLKKGVGLMEGSDIPMGKKGESSIIAGHRGYLWRSQFFWSLDELQLGDKVEVQTSDNKLTYEVIKVSKIQEDEVEKVLIDEDKTLIALVTSNPFWVTEDRILVEAELVK